MADFEKEDGSPFVGELDQHFAVDKEENDGDHVYDNMSQLVTPSLDSDSRYEVSQSPEKFPYPVPTNPDQEVMQKNVDYDEERAQTPSNNKHYKRDLDLHDGFFRNSSSPFNTEQFPNEMKSEESTHSQDFLSKEDISQGEDMENKSDMQRPISPLNDERVKEIISEKSECELTKSVYTEVERESADHQTGKQFSSPRLHLASSETKNEKFHNSSSSPNESEKLDMDNFQQHSPIRTTKRPVTARQMSVSPKRSPRAHRSRDVQDPLYSPRTRKHRHSSSPERSGAPSQRHLSPVRKSSASPQRTRRGSRHKDDSSRKDVSSGYKRGHRDRSRSRSPHTRDRHRRSPRRRFSPRRGSPPSRYHSRRRSTRQWSPPPNRSTGIGKPGRNLFVAGFNFLTTEKDLERKFSRFGRVRDVRIVRDKRSGDSRGFGFLSLERDEDADAAIRALDKTEWNGRVVLVEKSNSSGR